MESGAAWCAPREESVACVLGGSVKGLGLVGRMSVMVVVVVAAVAAAASAGRRASSRDGSCIVGGGARVVGGLGWMDGGASEAVVMRDDELEVR